MTFRSKSVCGVLTEPLAEENVSGDKLVSGEKTRLKSSVMSL